MKTVDQLREFFSTDLKPEITSVEANRKQIVFRAFAALFAVAALMIGAVLVLRRTELSLGWYVMIILVCGVLGAVLFLEIIRNRDFYIDFKTRVIERIVKFIDPSFTYISHKYILPTQLVDSRLFSNLPKKYKGDDYVVGVLGRNTKIEFSEVVARHRPKSQDGKSADWVTTFKGLFFVAQVENAFSGQTFAVPAGEGVDSLMLPTGINAQPAHLGDASFERYFTVYSTNAEEAKTLLTPEVCQKLVEFRSSRSNPVRLSFIGNKINVAVFHTKDLFEPHIFKSLLDFSIIQEYYDDLYQAISIVENVDASTRNRTIGTSTQREALSSNS